MAYIYLASPYSHKERKIMDERYHATMAWVANHMKIYKSPVIFSPILHCHDMARRHNIPHDARWWENYNISMLQSANALWVLKLKGWTLSKGICGDPDTGLKGELEFAKQFNKDIKFIDI